MTPFGVPAATFGTSENDADFASIFDAKSDQKRATKIQKWGECGGHVAAAVDYVEG